VRPLDAVPDDGELDPRVGVDPVGHLGVVHRCVRAHGEVLDPGHPSPLRLLGVAPVDAHVLEGPGLHPVRVHLAPGPVGAPLADPAPHLAVLVGEHGQPEPHDVAVAFEDLHRLVLGEQVGPPIHVVGHLPDQRQRRGDQDAVLGVSDRLLTRAAVDELGDLRNAELAHLLGNPRAVPVGDDRL
jgi:hypothetical protein